MKNKIEEVKNEIINNLNNAGEFKKYSTSIDIGVLNFHAEEVNNSPITYAKLLQTYYKSEKDKEENIDKILISILNSKNKYELFMKLLESNYKKNIKELKYFLNLMEEKELNKLIIKLIIELINNKNKNKIMIIKKLALSEKIKLPNGVQGNIHFKIGQPDTGKSFSFEEKILFPEGENDKDYKYFKMSVTGGLTGLDQRDISISTDPKTKETVISQFVWLLLSAIINPKIPHVVFFDDFHNTNISQLFSNFMPLLKKQNIKDLGDKINDLEKKDQSTINSLLNEDCENINEFILKWNKFIKELKDSYTCGEILSVNSIINPNDTNYNLDLVFPKNFYILGAANWNQNTNHIFADMENRASIEKIKPILDIEELKEQVNKNDKKILDFDKINENDKDKEFLEFILSINNSLKEILKKDNIFDYEQYCFGIFKIINNGKIEIEDKEETIKYFFRMIKNSLIEKGKSTEVNKIGFSLLKDISNNKNISDSIEEIKIIKKIRENQIIKDKNELDENCQDIYEILHELGIYSE